MICCCLSFNQAALLVMSDTEWGCWCRGTHVTPMCPYSRQQNTTVRFKRPQTSWGRSRHKLHSYTDKIFQWYIYCVRVTYKQSWENCGINNTHKYAVIPSYSPTYQHTCTHLGIWARYRIALKKYVNAQIPPECAGCPPPPEHAITTKALFIHSLFPRSYISHSKYNDLPYNF